MNRCYICKILKDNSNFYKDIHSENGLKNYCKLCSNIYQKTYYSRNKEKKKSKAKIYYDKNKEKINIISKAYYEKNKSYSRNYYNTNKDKIKAYSRAYYKTEKGRQVSKKSLYKRQYNLGFELLFDKPDEWLCPIEYHHISDGFVVAIPSFIHKQYLGKNHRQKLKPIVEMLYNISYFIKVFK